MFQIFRHGIDISRHHLKGVYICTVGKSRKQPSSHPAEIVCTLHEGRVPDDEEDSAPPDPRAKYGPITLSYQGWHATLRPWDPNTCIIAAGIHNRLIHFPIRPGSRVFALDCSLPTLSHIADIVGPNGRLIGVIGDDHPQRPSPEELRRFFKRHPSVSVVTEDIQRASLERYERLLSLPDSSRQAFLMGLHPRLGENSPIRQLAEVAPKVVRKIFDFVECNDAAKVKCLVVCHWPPGTRVDVIREVVLSHIDILQRWRPPRGQAAEPISELGGREGTEGDGNSSQDSSGGEGEGTASGAAAGDKGRERKRRPKGDSEPVPQWVLMDLPTHHIITNNAAPDVNNKLTEVVGDMKRLTSGLRTGLFAKEQLLLTPWFPNHALLLLKYAAHRDERTQKVPRRKFPLPPGLEVARDVPERAAGSEDPPPKPTPVPGTKPPINNAIPMPSFKGRGPPAPNGAPAAADAWPPESQGGLLPPGALQAAASSSGPSGPPGGPAPPGPAAPSNRDRRRAQASAPVGAPAISAAPSAPPGLPGACLGSPADTSWSGPPAGFGGSSIWGSLGPAGAGMAPPPGALHPPPCLWNGGYDDQPARVTPGGDGGGAHGRGGARPGGDGGGGAGWQGQPAYSGYGGPPPRGSGKGGGGLGNGGVAPKRPGAAQQMDQYGQYMQGGDMRGGGGKGFGAGGAGNGDMSLQHGAAPPGAPPDQPQYMAMSF